MYDLLHILDHLRLGVKNREEALHLSARLGFAATPWDDAAGCGWMLGHGAVSLLPGQPAGLSGITLDSPDVGAFAACLERNGTGFIRDGGRLLVPAPAAPGLALEVIASRPDFRRTPQSLNHPNGADGMLSVTLVMDNPEALAAAYDAAFGPFAATPTDDMLTIHCRNALIYIVTPDGFDHLHPDLDMDPPEAGRLGVLSLSVRDVAQAGACLKEQGVRCIVKQDHVTVGQQPGIPFGLELIGHPFSCN